MEVFQSIVAHYHDLVRREVGDRLHLHHGRYLEDYAMLRLSNFPIRVAEDGVMTLTGEEPIDHWTAYLFCGSDELKLRITKDVDLKPGTFVDHHFEYEDPDFPEALERLLLETVRAVIARPSPASAAAPGRTGSGA